MAVSPEDRAHRTGLITGLVIGLIGGGILGGIITTMANANRERGAVYGGAAPNRTMGTPEPPTIGPTRSTAGHPTERDGQR